MYITQKHTSPLQYIPPTLTQGKEWYISYYSLHPETGKLKRIKHKLNRIKSISQRKLVARQLISDISVKLAKGWNPFLQAEAPKSFHLLVSVLDTYIQVKTKELEANSMRSYISYVSKIKTWLAATKKEDIYVGSFTQSTAADFMLSFKTNEKISPRTYNNHLLFYRTLWNWLKEFSYTRINPFETIHKMKKNLTKKKRKPISKEQRTKLFHYLNTENPEYLVMCLLCYYCFLREKEIVSLRIKDILIDQQLIRVDEKIAKNDNTSYRTIPDVVIPFLKALDLKETPDKYVFAKHPGYIFSPGDIKMCERKVGKYWAHYIRPSLEFPMEVSFYSLKDAGITDMLSTVAPNYVQGQADHSSLEVTSIYAQNINQDAHEQIRKVNSF